MTIDTFPAGTRVTVHGRTHIVASTTHHPSGEYVHYEAEERPRGNSVEHIRFMLEYGFATVETMAR